MLAAGWHAHTLNAPGKFLVSAPEHDHPRRARAYLVTDDDVARTAARYARPPAAGRRVTRRARPRRCRSEPHRGTWPAPTATSGEPGDTPDDDTTTPEGALWLALCTAPEDGADIAELMRVSGMGRPTLYRYLAQLAQAGRAIQVGRGRWRATTTEEAT